MIIALNAYSLEGVRNKSSFGKVYTKKESGKEFGNDYVFSNEVTFRLFKYFDVGYKFNYFSLEPIDLPVAHAKITNNGLIFKTHYSPFKNFEIQPYVVPGCQVHIKDGKYSPGFAVEVGIGVEYLLKKDPGISLNFDIGYQHSFSNAVIEMISYELGDNGLDLVVRPVKMSELSTINASLGIGFVVL